MSVYRATISWQNSGPDFLTGQYSRAHQWQFKGGQTINATAAPDIVPSPWSDPANVDPEQAFVASLSSCHMLFFLSIAARNGIQVDSYLDQAEGHMEKNSAGRMAITRVILRPSVTIAGNMIPEQSLLDRIHHEAHRHCFIANSVHSEVKIEPLPLNSNQAAQGTSA